VLRSGKVTGKQDILTALKEYSSESEGMLTASWARPKSLETPAVRFESIDVRVEGAQPTLRLMCSSRITSEGGRPAFIAVDVLDQNEATIMQAIPQFQPFIGPAARNIVVDMTIELPPLVPGVYHLSFWIGPNHAETFDWICKAASIEIVDSPSPGRTFPHTPDHGFVVPASTVSMRMSNRALIGGLR
jgi:hypothetical protein